VIANAKQEQDLIEFDVRKTKAEKEIQQQAVDVLRSRAEDTQKEMDAAREVFQKTAKQGGKKAATNFCDDNTNTSQ
jgi:hypothetical protein